MPDDENEPDSPETSGRKMAAALDKAYVRREDFDALVERVAALEAMISMS